MNKLKNFLEAHNIHAEIIDFDEPVRTVEEAANLLGTKESQIVKTVIFLDEQNKLIAVVIQGNKKVSSNKVKKLLGIKRARVATREEVLKNTGYEAGAVPPLGFGAIFIMDKGVEGEVYAGGGTTTSLVKIQSEDIKNTVKARTADIAQEGL